MKSVWHKRLVLSLVTVAFTVFLVGCEDDESNALAKAQNCLDKITTNYQDASLCMDHIAKYDSQRANILKCSIALMDGGLTTNKVTTAYKNLSANTYSNKEAAFISVLALETGKADIAKPYCERSGLKGLIYIANLSVMATLMADTLGGIGYDPGSDATDMPTQQELDDMIANCEPGSSSGVNPCNHAAIGGAVIGVGNSYCSSANADSKICEQINESISGGGGNPELVAKQLFCKLQNKTYQATPTEGCI